ncbi:hypothetical protein LXL04_022359 [Taraxacum kok-saghyz]
MVTYTLTYIHLVLKMASSLKGGRLAMVLIILIVITLSSHTSTTAAARAPYNHVRRLDCDYDPIQSDGPGCGGGGGSGGSAPTKQKRTKCGSVPGSSRCKKGCCGRNKNGVLKMASSLKGGRLAMVLIILIVITLSSHTSTTAAARAPYNHVRRLDCDYDPRQSDLPGCGGGGGSGGLAPKKPKQTKCGSTPGSSRCKNGCCGRNKYGAGIYL